MTYNELMKKAGKRINPKVYYFQNEEKIEITKDDIKKAKPFFNASIVGTVMKGLELELTCELPNIPVYFENTVKYGTDSATKTIGPYYLKEKAEFNADSKTFTHKLYDKFITSMIDYKPITINYPTTVLEFFKKLCLECGFTTNIESLPNGNRVLTHDIYDGINYTCRDVFDDIGQATGTLFKINESNVEKCLFGTSVVTIDDDILKNKNIAISEHFGPINCVVLSRGADSDTIYKRDETLTSWNEFKISDNQLMNDNNRADYLDELYDALYGIEYDIFDLELVGYGGFNPLEKIQISTNSSIYNSYVFNNEEEYTQGYTESIYTELPEEAKTDYSKSDKTDKRINQTYLIVDKQNQIIESVVSNVGEQNEKISKVTQTVDELNSKISDVADITISAEQNIGYVELNDINASEPIRIVVRPIVENISYLYPSDNLYPSNNLFLKNRKIRFENTTTNEIFDYELPCDLLYYDSNNYDEFILDYGSTTVIVNKKVGYNVDGSTYVLENEYTKNYEYPKIQLTDGDYKVSILGYEIGYIFVRLMSKNIYTTQFYTKAETNSIIDQTSQSIDLSVNKKLENYSNTDEMNASINLAANNINQSVNQKITDVNGEIQNINANLELKVNEEDLISEINASADVINLKSNRLIVDSDNFKLDKKGNATMYNVNIKGGDIIIPEGLGHGMEVHANVDDNSYITRQRAGAFSCIKNGTTYAIMHDAGNSTGGVLQLMDSSGVVAIQCSGISGNIRCISLTQTSLEENKKDFEKYFGALEEIKNIDIYKYHLKEEDEISKKHIGFVIGNGYNYSSEITSIDETGKEVGVDTYSMTSLCLQAIKEQQEIIEKMQEEIEKLKKEEI